ncbi:hypothetical protein DPMN_036612 [Dreissena polymorpha]|uniref:Uncharacterized protein n=1 Tax=Dreissena polymorpha TaxID=45954 RepID=A0A9D4MB67_DREPO|nr:hypothetical protein DPMN_036612 [Dreissena polymorpha]
MLKLAQTDRQTNRQTGQKQYVPHYYMFTNEMWTDGNGQRPILKPHLRPILKSHLSNQTDQQTNRQTGQKQFVPHYYISHSENKKLSETEIAQTKIVHGRTDRRKHGQTKRRLYALPKINFGGA